MTKQELRKEVEKLLDKIDAVSTFSHPHDGPEMYANIKTLGKEATELLEKITGIEPLEKDMK